MMKTIFAIFTFFTLILNASANSKLTFQASKYELMSAMESKVQSMKSSIYLVLNYLGCDAYQGAYENLKSTIKESGAVGFLKTVNITSSFKCPSPLIINGTQTHFTEWVGGTNYYSYTIQGKEKTFTIQTTEETILED